MQLCNYAKIIPYILAYAKRKSHLESESGFKSI